jgi:hypothetical protein
MTKISSEEIQKYRIELADNPKALTDLDMIEDCGDLERATQLLTLLAGVEETRDVSSWQLALEKARKIVCDDKFKDCLVPGLIGGLIGAFATSGNPALTAAATPISIYIAQVGIDAFCKASKST